MTYPHYELRKFDNVDGKTIYIVYAAFREYQIMMSANGLPVWLTAYNAKENACFRETNHQEATHLEVLCATGAAEDVLNELVENLEAVKECKLRWTRRT